MFGTMIFSDFLSFVFLCFLAMIKHRFLQQLYLSTWQFRLRVKRDLEPKSFDFNWPAFRELEQQQY